MIENKAYFSKELNQHYRHCIGGVIFEDKVTYTDEELELIKNSKIPVETIHMAKLYFDGTMISDEDLKKLTEHYENNESEFSKACKRASEYIRSGMKGFTAIQKAAAEFSISPSAIGKELGKR